MCVQRPDSGIPLGQSVREETLEFVQGALPALGVIVARFVAWEVFVGKVEFSSGGVRIDARNRIARSGAPGWVDTPKK